jgi:flagellar assembly factor FliW
MKVVTSRFGTVDIEPDDILFFQKGVFGFEDCQHWVLLADADNAAVGWLQNIQHPQIALPVVSPRRFVPDYQVRLDPADIEPLQLAELEKAYVLAVVSRDKDTLTMNLRAPILINLDRRTGCQSITIDAHPIQFALAHLPSTLRRSA